MRLFAFTAAALLAFVAVVGCSSNPTTTEQFEYKATAGWYVGSTPNVTSMTIDGQSYASGENYTLDESYTSYAEARATFEPHNVVIATTTETLMFQINIGACENAPNQVEPPITKETDEFYAWQSLMPPPSPSVEFFAECGMCESKSKTVGYCARSSS